MVNTASELYKASAIILKVQAPSHDEIDQMKKKLGIVDGEAYRGLHLTVANGKNGSVFPDWPKLIEIKK